MIKSVVSCLVVELHVLTYKHIVKIANLNKMASFGIYLATYGTTLKWSNLDWYNLQIIILVRHFVCIKFTKYDNLIISNYSVQVLKCLFHYPSITCMHARTYTHTHTSGSSASMVFSLTSSESPMSNNITTCQTVQHSLTCWRS